MSKESRSGPPDNSTSKHTIDRRTIIEAMAVSGCLSLIGCVLGSPASADEAEPAQTLKPGDRFALEVEAGPLKPFRVDDIAPGTAVMGVYPIDPTTGKLRTETRLNMLNLARLSDAKAPASGVVAFSAVCTHKGCTINSWKADEGRWRCFCHMSEFDAAANGQVVAGPAPEPLPTVPVSVDADGYIVALGAFSSSPGAAS